ncbi:MAG: hypothetical protein ABI461_22880 [Polyangiaceae bacterium]
MLEIKRFGGVAALLIAAATVSCGGAKKDPNDPSSSGGDVDASDGTSSDTTSDSSDGGGAAAGAADDSKSKASVCTGFDIDLMQVLGQSACELAKPDDKQRDVKGVLELKLTSSAVKVAPGAHVDLVVTITNKSKDTVPVDFVLDPTPRFSTEAYDKKGHRVDMPTKSPPALPADIAERAATPQTMARIKLLAGGSAHAQIGWDAVTMKWAPDKVHGTPPEMGYPRVPAGKLAKGKYTVHVVTPLTNVLEGADKDVSSPLVEIEVGR